MLLGCNAYRDRAAGVAGTVLQMGEALADRGWRPVYQFLGERAAQRWERQLTYFRMVAAVARHRPDVAVIGSGDGALLPLVAPRTPLVVHSHGLEHMHREAIETHGLPSHFGSGHRYVREPAVAFTSRRADMLVVQTSKQASYAVDRYRCAPDRVMVIPNAIEDDFFAIQRRPAVRPTVALVGGWGPNKGATWLPLVLTELHRLVPDVVLHLVGTGTPAEPVLGAFASEDHCALKVTPRATRAEVRAALAEATVGLVTSSFEGFGRAIVEIMAAGLPLVSTDVGAASDLVLPGKTGRLVPVGDAAGTAAALAEYLTDPAAARDQGVAARAAVASYRWGPVGDQWDALLRQLA